jgi:23S rRNA (adenine2503-C2)-methyltransferase
MDASFRWHDRPGVEVTTIAKINLLGLSKTELGALFADLGEASFRASQVFHWIHQKGERDFAKMSNLSKGLQARLSELYEIRPPIVQSEHLAPDGTRKWLLTVDGGGAIEAVYIPEKTRATLCISSQVGCMLKCTFCCTAQQGFQRNLTAAEVIGQLWLAFHTIKQEQPDKEHPITNVVFMGMGEPLLNYEPVLSSIKIMRDDLAYGLSKRRVTLSTSGLVPVLKQFIEDTDIALAISLHAPNDKLRDELVPINRKYPIASLLEACKAYTDKDHDRHVTIEYVMLDQVNDSIAQARALVRVLQGLPVKINLIPFNPFPGTRYKRSSPENIESFANYLKSKGLFTFARKTRGNEIAAACGQLAGDVKDRTKRQSQYRQNLIEEKLV